MLNSFDYYEYFDYFIHSNYTCIYMVIIILSVINCVFSFDVNNAIHKSLVYTIIYTYVMLIDICLFTYVIYFALL